VQRSKKFFKDPTSAGIKDFYLAIHVIQGSRGEWGSPYLCLKINYDRPTLVFQLSHVIKTRTEKQKYEQEEQLGRRLQ